MSDNSKKFLIKFLFIILIAGICISILPKCERVNKKDVPEGLVELYYLQNYGKEKQ